MVRQAWGSRAFFTLAVGVGVALLVEAFVGLALPFLALVAVSVGSVLFAATFHVRRPVTAGD